jgi:hypothetical protein
VPISPISTVYAVAAAPVALIGGGEFDGVFLTELILTMLPKAVVLTNITKRLPICGAFATLAHKRLAKARVR